MSTSSNTTEDLSAGDAILSCTTGSGGVISSNSNCYNTTIDASQIVFGLAINSGIGVLCYVGFVLWRGEFRVYFNRLVSPFVSEKQRPPPLQLRGHYRLWSWLIPVFKLPDGELLESAGLDALVAQRILGFGCLALLPLSVLAVAVLIPVNYTSYTPAVKTQVYNGTASVTANTSTSINDEFLRMTMSAVPFGSNLLLVHFFFTYIFIGWVCWLLVQYYKEFISLRQAHDHRLLQSTELGRRNSLLEETAAPGSSQQIAKYLRLPSMHRSSCASVNPGGTLPAGPLGSGGSGPPASVGSGDRRISVRFSDGVPAGHGSAGELVMAAGSGGSARSVQAMVVLEDRHSTTSRSELGEQVAAAPRPQETAPPRTQASPAGSQELRATASNGLLPDRDSGVGLRQQYGPGTAPAPSPFEVAARGGVFTLPRSSAGSLPSGEGGKQAADVEQAGGGGSGGADPSGPPQWDELAEPLPLVDTADAAQFYTVLVVDAPVEEFTYRHTDSPWMWHMPTKLAGTPRLSLEALEGFVTKSKALARLNSVKEREQLEHRHRRMQVAEEAYTQLFGKDFDRIVPLYNMREPDALMTRWWAYRSLLDHLWHRQAVLRKERAALEAAQAAAEDKRRRRLQEELEAVQEEIRRLEEEADLQQQQQQQVEAQQQQQQQVEAQQQQQQHVEVHVEGQPGLAPAEQQQQQQAGTEQAGGQGGTGGGDAPHGRAWNLPGCCGRAKAAGEEASALSISKGAVNGTASADNSGGNAPPAAPPSKPKTKWGRKLVRLAEQERKLDEEIVGIQGKLADLQSEFEDAQLVATEALPAPCFFATFRTAQAAAQAARLNLNPLHERMMRALPAPAPNNVNYAALLRNWMSRGTRPMVVSIFVALMILFPIGMFAGVCGTIVSSACGGSNGTTNPNWFCSDNNFAQFLRNLISSTLPAILLSVWQAIVLPLWFYNCAQAESTHFSYSALDLRCAHWFFVHDLLNVFLGGMLGGSVMWGLRAVIDDPKEFFNILGQAAPASSNFFINYVSYRALAMTAFRLFFPHAAVFGGILKWLRLMPKPQTERAQEEAALPINCRYSRDLGVLQLTVFVVCLAYAIVSPLILPFGLLYFLLTWPVWRYQMLYVYQGHYDCQGQFWIYCAHRIVICLGVMSSFTSALLATKGAYAQGLVLFFTTVGFLWWFDTYLTMRYDNVVDQVPAVGYLLAPRARVDDRLYVPPPMRPQAAGWNPEWGKAWTGYGVPRYGF